MTYITSIEEFAQAVLERPSDAAFWDDRLYTSHGPIYAWAERGDDILSESNYRTILAHLIGAAGEDSEEHVIDASVKHWAVGSLRQIFVQVYEGGTYLVCSDCFETVPEGDEGHGFDLIEEVETSNVFTPAFLAAWEVFEALRDYPVWDESDYSELEWQRTQEAYADALNFALNYSENDAHEALDGLTDAETGYVLDILSQLWGDAYGYAEEGWVDPDSISSLIPDAIAEWRRRLTEDAGQVTLDLKED